MPRSRNLDVKIKVDTRQSKTALQGTAKDMANVGKAGKKAAEETKRSWNGLRSAFKNTGQTLKTSFKGVRTSMAGAVGSARAFNRALKQNVTTAKQLKDAIAKTRLSGAGGEGGGGGGGGFGGGLLGGLLGGGAAMKKMSQLVQTTRGDMAKLNRVIEWNETSYRRATKALRQYGEGAVYITGRNKGASATTAGLSNTLEKLKQRLTEAGVSAKETAKRLVDLRKGVPAQSSLKKSIMASNKELDKQKSLLDKLKAGWLQLAAVGIGAIAAWDLAGFAAKADDTRKAFNTLSASFGLNGQSIVKALQEASKGTVHEFKLMEAAGTAMLLGINKDQETFIRMMKIARATSKVTGQTVSDAFADITLALGRQSKMILDNLGIIVKLDEAYANFAMTNNIVGRSLTEIEKKAAFMTEALRKGDDMVKRIGIDAQTTAELLAKWGTTWDTVKYAIGKFASAVIRVLAIAFNTIGILVNKSIEYLFAFLKGIIDITSRIPGVGKKLDGLSKSLSGLRLQFKGAADIGKEFNKEVAETFKDNAVTNGAKKLVKDMKSGNEEVVAISKERAQALLELERQLAVSLLGLQGETLEASLEAANQRYDAMLEVAKGYAELTAKVEKARLLELEKITVDHEKNLLTIRLAGIDNKIKAAKEEADRSEEIFKAAMETRIAFLDKINSLEIRYLTARGDTYEAAVQQMIYAYEKDMKAWEHNEIVKTAITKAYVEERLVLAKSEADRLAEAKQKEIDDNKNAFQQWTDQYKDFGKFMAEWTTQVAEQFSSGMTDGLFEWIEGTKSAKDAFKDFASTFLNDIARMIVQQAILNGLRSAGGYFGMGGLFGGGKAAGGAVSKGTGYIVGEKGPEMFMPGGNGTIVPNHRLNTGAVTVASTINVSVGGGAGGNNEDSKKLGKEVSIMIEKEFNANLMKQMRPGGMLNKVASAKR